MDIIVVIAFVCTQMLFNFVRVWAFNYNGNDEVIRRPLVMLIGPCNVKSKRGTLFVDQQVDLAAPFASIGRVFARFFASQRRWARLTVNRLPLPANFSLGLIVQHHLTQHIPKDTLFSPSLETLVNHTAGHTKPVLVNRFPLTACPQHIPNAIQRGSIISAGPSWANLLWLRWKELLDRFPQFIRYLEVVDIFRLCASIVARRLLVGIGFSSTPFSTRSVFLQSYANLRIGSKVFDHDKPTQWIKLEMHREAKERARKAGRFFFGLRTRDPSLALPQAELG
jgi:hypothetical protein